MRLADFILREPDSIIENWESFARTCLPAAHRMTDLGKRSEADEEDSLGLGLSIVREVASAHGGSVDARCTATETRFSVRLPET